MKNYYTVLEVPVGSEIGEIRESYRRLIQQNLFNKEEFAELQEAFEVLNDPMRRSDYDKATFGDAIPLQHTDNSMINQIESSQPEMAQRCPMGAAAQCPVINARVPLSDSYCPECGFLIASLPTADFEPSVAAAVPTAGQPRLEEETGRQHRLAPGKNTVGREQADVLIPDKTISRLHAQIEIVGDGTITVEDLGSTNGTQVNGERLTTHFPRTVTEGDTVRFGSVRLMLRLPSANPRPTAVDDSDMVPGVVSDPNAALTEPPKLVGDAASLIGESSQYIEEVLSTEPMTAEPSVPDYRPAIGAKLIGIRGDLVEEYPLVPGVTTFGRRAVNSIVIRDDPYVSGTHAQIIAEDDTYRLTDLGSTNGTLYNSEKVVPDEPLTLSPGDEIAIGGTIFRFERTA